MQFNRTPLNWILAVTLLLPGALVAQAPQFDNDSQEMLYYWGTSFGQQLQAAGLEDRDEIDWIIRGLREQVAGTAPEFGEEYRSLLNNYLVRRQRERAEQELMLAGAYVGAMAKADGAMQTESGLVYQPLRPGTGARPDQDSRIEVHYVGTLRDGSVFDSSRDRGEPLKTRLSRVIACWTEALPLMQVGGTARITCPPELAYGERGTGRIPGGAALTFEIELLDIID